MHLNTFEHEMKKKPHNKTKYSTAHSTEHIRHDNEFYSYGVRGSSLSISAHCSFAAFLTARFSVFILNIDEPLR